MLWLPGQPDPGEAELKAVVAGSVVIGCSNGLGDARLEVEDEIGGLDTPHCTFY